MFKRVILSSSLALLMAANAPAPATADGGGAAETPPKVSLPETPAGAASAAAPGAPDTNAAVGDEAPNANAPQEVVNAPKQKGNAFARAITAPFRALARLFGGPKKISAAKRQKQEPRPEPRDDAARAQPARAPVGPVEARREAAPPAVMHTDVAAAGPSKRTTDAGVTVVRPSEIAPAGATPKVFIPVIEGVGRDPLSQGRALLEHGFMNEAISELSIAATAVGGGANLVEANNLLGLAYDRLGWHRKAAECYQRALTVAPGDPIVLANLGYSLYLSDDFNGALRRLKEAARIRPGLTVVHNNIGIVSARVGKYDDAFKSFARATNQYDAHLKLASILEAGKRDRQAVKHYEAALRLQPNTNAVVERLVALYERTGDRVKADIARRSLGQPTTVQKTVNGGG